MKHEIAIEGLPEGRRAVAYRIALCGVDHVLRNGKVTIYNGFSDDENLLIVEKIPPRRIVLEETEKNNFKYTNGFYANQVLGGGIHIVDQPRIWRVVDGNEATFRDRVREDLIKNKVIVK